ncbi:hypothetical protein [Kribbella sp. C-35]|uniref:hypothetical protein n=1 Tax=Kribbella sp. C-35 TaxID=2789276 RepID=UPI0039783E28
MISLQTAEIDPNVVKPGWVALLIVLALGAATVLLVRNMGKQLKRIDFDRDGADDPAPSDDPASQDRSASPATDAAPTTSAPTQTPSDSKEHSEH